MKKKKRLKKERMKNIQKGSLGHNLLSNKKSRVDVPDGLYSPAPLLRFQEISAVRLSDTRNTYATVEIILTTITPQNLKKVTKSFEVAALKDLQFEHNRQFFNSNTVVCWRYGPTK